MSIEDDIAFLERVPTLAVLGRSALRILAIGADNRYVHTGEVLFSAGDAADAAFVVQQGSFGLKARGSDQEEASVAGPGALLGEFALLTETTRTATATAREPSNLLRIPRGLFLKMLEGFPDAAFQLRNHMAARAERTAREMAAVRPLLTREPGEG